MTDAVRSKKGKKVLGCLADLGGAALISEISAKSGMTPNGISQTLSRTDGWEKVTTKKAGLGSTVMIKLTREYKETHLFWH